MAGTLDSVYGISPLALQVCRHAASVEKPEKGGKHEDSIEFEAEPRGFGRIDAIEVCGRTGAHRGEYVNTDIGLKEGSQRLGAVGEYMHGDWCGRGDIKPQRGDGQREQGMVGEHPGSRGEQAGHGGGVTSEGTFGGEEVQRAIGREREFDV